jgi:glycosyltransferase involved in cell wall biosynthesis
VPLRTKQPVELALGLVDSSVTRPGFGDLIPAVGMTADERLCLAENGWQLRNSHAFTTDLWTYRAYIQASRGEFTVAKDQNVRLRSGWFSERSACYLAAGRPVVTQDTGFGSVLPVGEGLFAFKSVEDILAAFEAINSDYERHSRAARAVAEEYFRAETVLARLLEGLGL